MEANDERHARRSLTSSRSQTPHNVPNAALTGALLAFSRPTITPAASYSRTPSLSHQHNAAGVTKLHDGALSAAKTVHDLRTRSAAPPTLTPAYTGDSTTSYFGLNKEFTGTKQEITPEWSASASRTTSPASSLSSRPAAEYRPASFTAAALAARRHQRTEVGSHVVLDPRALALQRRLDERRVARDLYDSMDEKRERPDMTSIDSTRNLVHLFEQNSGSSGPDKPMVTRHVSLAKGKPPPIVAPKPQRTVSVHTVSPELRRPDLPVKPKPLLPVKPEQNGDAPVLDRPATAIATQDPQKTIETPKPNVPPPRRSTKRTSIGARDDNTSSAPPAQLSRFGLPLPASSKPSPASQTHVIPSNKKRTSPAPYKDTSLNMLTPHMTGDSMANAIVGANLALRSPSPMKRSRTPPPVPGPRRKQHHHGIDMLQGNRARSLSPQKKQPGRFLTTLRGDEAEEKLKTRKHHFRQPNKHHEGTRERWRDYVSEPERKRYEGVWAANRGLYISNAAQAEEVVNLVVRDIWSRSRLPPEKLARVWDLVAVDDEDENGDTDQKRRSLTREQFVVGLWLIDQVLKGRNLPHSVNASVWTSVRLMGVKVRLEGKGKDGRKLERGTAW